MTADKGIVTPKGPWGARVGLAVTALLFLGGCHRKDVNDPRWNPKARHFVMNKAASQAMQPYWPLHYYEVDQSDARMETWRYTLIRQPTLPEHFEIVFDCETGAATAIIDPPADEPPRRTPETGETP